MNEHHSSKKEAILAFTLAALLIGSIFVGAITLGRIAYAQEAGDSAASDSSNSADSSSDNSSSSSSNDTSSASSSDATSDSSDTTDPSSSSTDTNSTNSASEESSTSDSSQTSDSSIASSSSEDNTNSTSTSDSSTGDSSSEQDSSSATNTGNDNSTETTEEVHEDSATSDSVPGNATTSTTKTNSTDSSASSDTSSSDSAHPSEDTNDNTTSSTDGIDNSTSESSDSAVPSAPTYSPTIWTDKADYAPGELVTIYGSGFYENAIIWIIIYNPNEQAGYWNTTSDDLGSFVSSFTLGGYQPYYTLIATDGVNYAETTFTDSPKVASISASPVSNTVTQGTPASFTATATRGSGGDDIAISFSVINNPTVAAVSSFTPTGITCTPSCPSAPHTTLSISTGSLSPGTYTFNIRGTRSDGGAGNDFADSSQLTLIVNAPTASLTILKTIINDNGGDSGIDDFDFFVNTTQVDNGTSTSFSPGFYNISETGLAGYNSAFGGDCDEFGGITLQAGDDKICTITNNDIPAKLTIIKTIINDNGGDAVVTDFNFYVNGTTEVFNDTEDYFDAGFYNITEIGPFGYNATFSGDCDEFGGITLEIGQEYTCGIVNDDIAPKLVFIKYVVNDNGGTQTNFAPFFANASEPNETELTNNTTTELPMAGTYNITENGGLGYTVTFEDDCAPSGQLTIGIGEELTCTIINDDIPPMLTLIKYVINDNGGTQTDFSPFMANVSQPNETVLAVNDTTTLPMAGTYNITENVDMSKYSAIFGDDCAPSGQITITIGETLTCSITNDDIQPELTVIKYIINDNGGTATIANFTLYVNSSIVGNGTLTGFDAGFYNVSEVSAISGYNATFSAECDEFGGITLDIGDEKTCIITNDDIAPRLTIIKYIINDNGGAATLVDFEFFVNATTPAFNDTAATLPTAGFYNVTESGPFGYNATFSDDCGELVAGVGGVSLNIGDDKTCTITNDDIPAKLTIIKTIINDNGGNAVLDDFAFYVNGTQVYNDTAADFDAGFYNLTEIGPFGYNATFSGDCDEFGGITLEIGQEYTCGIVNDDIAPKLTIIKHIINDDGRSATLDDFNFYANGTEVFNNTAADFDAGFYNVTEFGPGYIASFGGDCDEFGGITMEIGQEYTCEIVNDDLPFSAITTPGGVPFDMDSADGQQFRLIFTHDPTNTNAYKLTASNPGQMAYNVFYVGVPGEPFTVNMTIPYPFVTQGADPTHAYDSVTIDGNGAYVPGTPLSDFDVSGTDTLTPSGKLAIELADYTFPPGTVTLTVNGTVPASGFVYVIIHLDYGLKGTPGYSKGASDFANTTGTINDIPNMNNYVFGVSFTDSSDPEDTETIINKNIFKHDPGFVGLVSSTSTGDPIRGAKIQVYTSAGKLVGTTYTDENGYYQYYYKYTGKSTTFIVKLVDYSQQQSVTLKANGFAVAYFQIQ